MQMRAIADILDRPTADSCTCITRTAAQPRDLLRNPSKSQCRSRTRSWNWTTVQTQERLRTVCVRSAAAETAETTGTAARSSRRDPEVAEASTRTGRELGLSPVTTMAATVVVKAATVHATGCPTVPGTAAVAKVAVKAAGGRERGTQHKNEWMILAGKRVFCAMRCTHGKTLRKGQRPCDCNNKVRTLTASPSCTRGGLPLIP